jgi:Ulp1 family protease
LVFHIRSNELLHYDSIENEERHEFINQRIKFFLVFLESVTNQKLQLVLELGESSRQTDGSSCGVYTCFTAHRIAKYESLIYTPAEAENYRQKMAQNLSLNN